MPYIDQKNNIPVDEFSTWLTAHIRWWAHDRFRKGRKRSDFPDREDYELYADKVGVSPGVIYNLMQYKPTPDTIPAEVLMDLGFAIGVGKLKRQKEVEVAILFK